MRYPAKFWGQLCAKVEQYLPVRFSEALAGRRSHPWQLQAQYFKPRDKKSYWRVRAEPGVVNGLPAYMSMLFEEAPPDAQERIIKEAEAQDPPAKKPGPKDTVTVYLDEAPAIELRFRNAIPGAPEYFQRLGCTDPVANRLGEPQDTATRLLKSSDIVLVQPRPSLTNQVVIQPFGAGTLLVSTPGLFVPKNREPFVISMPQFIPKPPAPASFKSVFFNTFEDTGRDDFHLSRVFLLSPPLPLKDPDDLSVWQPYYQYNCHYNLVFATKQIAKAKTTYEKPLILQTALAFGLADSIFNNLLTGGQNFSASMLAHLKERELKGIFYAI